MVKMGNEKIGQRDRAMRKLGIGKMPHSKKATLCNHGKNGNRKSRQQKIGQRNKWALGNLVSCICSLFPVAVFTTGIFTFYPVILIRTL